MTTGTISAAAVALIIEEEVGSEAQYRHLYANPTWPGGGSGVTIGIGFDLGTQAPEAIRDAWTPYASTQELGRLVACSGVLGEPARGMAAAMRDIMIPWEAACAVFQGKTLPDVTAQVLARLPNADSLGPDCLGALVSLAYNRGASFMAEGPRYLEMRGIAAAAAQRNWGVVPGLIQQMKRLWVGKGLDGLLRRRDREAALFEAGLQAVPPAPPRPAAELAAAERSRAPSREESGGNG